MSPTTEETLQKINQQISQLQARKKTIENRERQKAKREHTRRLIQFGTLVEKYLPFQTPAEFEEFLKKYRKITDTPSNTP